MLPIRFLMDACVILSHSWTNMAPSSWILLGWIWRADIAVCKLFQTCSIGFKSGERAGQSRHSISSLSRCSWVAWAVWGQALSSIRMKGSPITLAHGLTWTSRMSSLYRSICHGEGLQSPRVQRTWSMAITTVLCGDSESMGCVCKVFSSADHLHVTLTERFESKYWPRRRSESHSKLGCSWKTVSACLNH